MIKPNIVKVPFRKLKHIHHISDIQIRNLKRHKEYEEVFERTYEEVRKNKDNAVAYIGGDIAHSKTDMSPELVDQLSRLFKNLADICPTIIIAGNHDCNLNNRSRLDVLTPIVDNLNHPNLHYLKDSGGDGKSYKINHSVNKFKEPLFAFVPSIGISSLNNCPKVLIEYYKTPCLLALSLRGNNLRTGKSLIIFLLNNEMKKINSIEKIYLGNLKLRHFVTNKRNELYEDKNGNIYISADKKGIYRINFSNFR